MSASLATSGPANEPAAVAIDVRLHAVDDQHVFAIAAELHAGPVFDDAAVLVLDVALPPGFDGDFDAGEARLTTLANAGTTNGDLEPLCGQQQTLFVYVSRSGNPVRSFPEEPDKADVSRPVSVDIQCVE